MSASYPGAVKTFASRNAGDVIQPAHINDLQDEVNALEAGLLNGTAPLNSSHSTLASLSVLGKSTFAGNVVFSSAVTLTFNGSVGVSGQVLQSNGSSGVLWSNAPASLKAYTVTPSTVANTNAADQTILSFTVPGNDMADGDVIEIVAPFLAKNNKGTNGTVVIKMFWGASSITIGGDSWTNSATEQKVMGRFSMTRVGADLWVRSYNVAVITSDDYDYTLGNVTADGSNLVVVAAPTFSSDQTIAVKITFSAADALFYWKTQSARAYKVAGS